MKHRLPRTVVILGLVSFFNDMASEMVTPFIPILIATVLGAGPVVLGLVEGVADAGELSQAVGRTLFRCQAREAQYTLWLSVITYGLITGLSEGSERALISVYADEQERGTAFGWYYLAVGSAPSRQA